MCSMAVGQEVRRWEAAFARRTRGGAGEGLIAILALAGAKDVISFAGGLPDPATFPAREVAKLLGELAESGDPSPFQYSPTQGLPGPRDFVAGRLERLEGRRPADDEMLLTSGAIEALELVGKAFVDRGDCVLVEAPTYLGAVMAFQSFEAKVVGVPVDDDGLSVDELDRLLVEGLAPTLLYTIPDFQNPTGVTLAPERRQGLVELARRHGFLIVEDVAYRDLAFGEDRPPSLWALAPDVVVQAGTFSKTFFPGVRLGWAAGPGEIVAKLIWAKQNTDQCAGALGQRLLEEYGRRGLLDERVAEARALYRRRRDALLGALDAHLAGRATWTRPEGGFFVWLELPPPADALDIAARARKAGVAVVPGAPFFPDPGHGARNLRFSFSGVDEDEIAEGIRRLAPILR
jgi:2-aminoadipate transaminase